MIVFLLLARKSAKEKGTCVEESEPISRSIEGFVVFIYTTLFTVN